MHRKHHYPLYSALTLLLLTAQPAFADTDGSDSYSTGEPASVESGPPDRTQGSDHAGGDNSNSEKNSSWQACWQAFIEKYQGSQDRREEWYYDGTCTY